MSRDITSVTDPTEAPGSAHRGRPPATTHVELSRIALDLFLEHGFEETTVDDIVREAGIGRRTFFRYFTSKNELLWGDFSDLLETFRVRLEGMDPQVPLVEALRTAIVEFNTFPDAAMDYHRGRMWMLFNVPSLNAYSMLKYAAWREVIAEFVAHRLGGDPADLTPQTVAWAWLGMCIGVYERWLGNRDADLHELFDAAFRTAVDVFGITPRTR